MENSSPRSRAVYEKLKSSGYSESVINLIISSCSKSTWKQYEVYIIKWLDFCSVKKVPIFDPPIEVGLDFLSDLVKSGLGYSAVNTARSALSFLLNEVNGKSFGENKLVTRLMKGVYRLRPPLPKYTAVWDTSSVLNTISNWKDNNELDFKTLSYKLVSLLALTTAQRVQTLSLIKLKNIHFDCTGVSIAFTDIIKTSVATRKLTSLKLDYFTENVKLCVVDVLKHYIESTRLIRNGEEYLILSIVKPFKRVGTQTISRWLKDVLNISGIDVSKYSAHSYRHASVSKAADKGCSVDIIFKYAGWTEKSKVFGRFYHRSIESNQFVNSVLS